MRLRPLTRPGCIEVVVDVVVTADFASFDLCDVTFNLAVP